MNYKFTDRVRKVLVLSREEAIRLRHDYVGTEHLLLGLVREREGIAAAVLEKAGIAPEAVRVRVETLVRKGAREGFVPQGELPYTSRAKKTLEYGMAEARAFHHSYFGTEHLLLGLLREEKGIAAQLLNSCDLSLERARSLTASLLLAEGGASEAGLADRAAEEADGESGRFHLTIDDASDLSIYEQIVARIQEAVATGVLSERERLPAVRRLADELDIAPGTVARAYMELERRGVVVTEGARGTRVAPRTRGTMPLADRPGTLLGLLRPVVVAAYHLGATAAELRQALDGAMRDIFPEPPTEAA